MRIVTLSDTHSYNERIGAPAREDDRVPSNFVPDGDILIHAGDLTDTGKPNQLFDAYAWLSKMPHEQIIVVPGNHDFGLERIPELRATLDSKFPRVQTLLDEDTMLGDMRVFGSAWTPFFHDWAFNFLPGPADERQAEEKWNAIPDDTAILVTHGPPYGIHDKTLRGKYVGDAALKRRIGQLKSLKLHVFGHIHECYGTHGEEGVVFVNACTCDHLYDPIDRPIVLDWDGTAMHVVTSL